ncbi:MAG: inducible mutagenesis protein A [Roseibium sp.]
MPDAAQNRTEHSTSLAELRRRIAGLEGRLPFETQFAPAPVTAANPQGPETFSGKQAPNPSRTNHPARNGQGSDRCSFQLEALDTLFQADGGLKLGALHEIVSAQSRHSGALSGFVFALLARLLETRTGSVLIVQDPRAAQEAGQLHGPGLAAFGIDPARLIIVRPRRMEELLWCLEEGASCTVLAAVLGEVQGSQRLVDLTATRRIGLRAERSQMPVFILRHAAECEPTAATTRWQITPAVSRPPDLLKDGPHPGLGAPVWRIELTRNRDGRPGHLTVEWNHETRKFAAPAHSLALDRGSALRPDPASLKDRIVPFRSAG